MAAAGLDVQMPSRSPTHIRYSDVANYVGLSLVREPGQMRSTPKRQQSVPAGSSRSPPASSTPKEELSAEPSRVDSLPTIQVSRPDHLRCQLEWLRAEQRAEKEQLRRLESSLSDSMLLERKAHTRVMKNKEMRDHHNSRVQDVELKISKLKGELEAQQHVAKAPRPSPQQMAIEKRANGSPPRHEAPRREESRRLEQSSPTRRAPAFAEPAAADVDTVLPPLEAEQEDSFQQTSGTDRQEAAEHSRQSNLSDPPTKGRPGGHHGSGSDTSALRRKKLVKNLDSSELTQAPEDLQHSEEERASPSQDCEGAMSSLKHHTSTPNTPQVGRATAPGGGGGGGGSSWIKQYMNIEISTTQRYAKWQPGNPEEKIQNLLEAAQLRSEGAAKKKWMSSTFRRLKTRGKSDARCREVVALHLPRGSGPKDREDVPIFSQNEVRTCKKMYTDCYMEPVKRIQKVIVDMKEQKRELRAVREDLFMVTEARLLQQRAEEDRKNAVTSIGGLGLLSKVKDTINDEAGSGGGSSGSGKKSFKKIADENYMDEDGVTDLYREYLKFADSSELLGRKAFTRLLQALCPTRTLVDSDLDAWWGQVTRSQDKQSAANSRRTQCKFEEFVVWYSSSEART